MIQEGARQKPYDLTSGVTHHHYRDISFFVKYVSLICCVGGLPNSMNTRRGGHWEPSWNLPSTASFSSFYQRISSLGDGVMLLTATSSITACKLGWRKYLSVSEHQSSQKVSDWPSVGSYVLLWKKSPWLVSPGIMLLTLRLGQGSMVGSITWIT